MKGAQGCVVNLPQTSLTRVTSPEKCKIHYTTRERNTTDAPDEIKRALKWWVKPYIKLTIF